MSSTEEPTAPQLWNGRTTVPRPYNDTYSATKETLLIYDNVEESQTHYTELKKPNLKEYLPVSSHLYKILEKAKLISSGKKPIRDWLPRGGVRDWLQRGTKNVRGWKYPTSGQQQSKRTHKVGECYCM